MKIFKLITLIPLLTYNLIFAEIPESINFDNLLPGETSEKIVTITNKGDLDLVIYNIYQTGINDSLFEISGDSTFILSKDNSKEILVSFNPLSTDLNVSTLIIESNDPVNDSTIITLRGLASPFVINTMNDSTFFAGDSIIYQYNSRSENYSDTLIYSLINGPPNATINSSTGLFKWNNIIPGSYELVVLISDNHGNDVKDTTNLKIGLHWGDTNLDYTNIDTTDAFLVLDHAMGTLQLTGDSLIVADVSNDSIVSAFDASYILRYYYGLIDQFPAEIRGIPKKTISSGEVDWNILKTHRKSDKVQIPVFITNDPTNVYSIELKIRCKDSEVTINDMISNLPAGWQMSSSQLNDQVIIVMAGITPLDESRIALLDLNIPNSNPGLISGTYQINSNGQLNMETLHINQTPVKFTLNQNYPNPFNSSTIISYIIEKENKVKLEVYNLLGQNIRTLVNSKQIEGSHYVYWDGLSDNGKQLPTGNYFYRITSGSYIESKKMTLMK